MRHLCAITARPVTPSSSLHANRYALSTSVFLRMLALIHVAAFLSFWVQLPGLIGTHGISPASVYLQAVREQVGSSGYAQLPTLCWWFGADTFLHVLCGSGVAAAVLLFAGIAPGICLSVLWLAYLSLVNVGQNFLGFQWDALLLETTLLAIWVAPFTLLPRWRAVEPPPLARWLLLWLLFRLMLLSGVVKLTSGDPTWRNLTALTFHYETQPLPTPLAWWAHHAPTAVHRTSCVVMFVIELAVPFLLFAPRRLRHIGAVLLIALQLGVAVTGNYAFFNFLTIALCIIAIDDAFWLRLFPRHFRTLRETGPLARTPAAHPLRIVGVALGTLVIAYTSLLALPAFGHTFRLPNAVYSVAARIGPFNSFNNYGLFAVMTTSRPELIFEGSNDAQTWLPYELPYKPGDLARRPRFVAPHQPRLDWQLWFAALMPPEQNPWVLAVCEHLLRGTPEVLALFSRNPFASAPPRYVRVVRYDYHFTSASERRETGNWWRRTPQDLYVPPSALR
jgi:hypothetical protein